MGRKIESDIISEAHEHAEHNINPHYWLNRIDNFRFAEWRARLGVSVIETVLISAGLLFTVAVSIAEGKFQSIPFVLLVPFWILSMVRTMRWFSLRREQKRNEAKLSEKPKEKRKKLPKRPKNYGRG